MSDPSRLLSAEMRTKIRDNPTLWVGATGPVTVKALLDCADELESQLTAERSAHQQTREATDLWVDLSCELSTLLVPELVNKDSMSTPEGRGYVAGAVQQKVNDLLAQQRTDQQMIAELRAKYQDEQEFREQLKAERDSLAATPAETQRGVASLTEECKLTCDGFLGLSAKLRGVRELVFDARAVLEAPPIEEESFVNFRKLSERVCAKADEAKRILVDVLALIDAAAEPPTQAKEEK